MTWWPPRIEADGLILCSSAGSWLLTFSTGADVRPFRSRPAFSTLPPGRRRRIPVSENVRATCGVVERVVACRVIVPRAAVGNRWLPRRQRQSSLSSSARPLFLITRRTCSETLTPSRCARCGAGRIRSLAGWCSPGPTRTAVESWTADTASWGLVRHPAVPSALSLGRCICPTTRPCTTCIECTRG